MRHVVETSVPSVSVVVPTLDRRSKIVECLEGLACQTHRDFEVVAVDDGSTDDTPTALERLAASHPDLALTVLRNEENRGANASRNRGVEVARGAVVAFLDDDCVPEPTWLERLVVAFGQPGVGAVNGLVIDAPARNIFELAFKGTHRIARPGKAGRLLGGNMAARRGLLLRFPLDEDRDTTLRRADGTPDMSISGRTDEEGLCLLLRAAGFDIVAAPEAVVVHDHPMTGRSFLRQAWLGGRSAARLVYKYHLTPRLDMLPFMLAWGTLAVGLFAPRASFVSALFFLAALTSITYNDLVRKGKTLREWLVTLPVLLLYYHVRLAGYVSQAVTLRLFPNRITRTRPDQIAAPGRAVMPKILMFLRGDIVTEARASKEIQSLTRAGYRLSLAEVLVTPRDENPKVAGFELETVPLWSGGLPRSSLGLAVKFLEMTLRLLWIAVGQKPDVIHCHDVEPLPAAAIASRLLNRPFIYDCREIQSEMPGMRKPKWFWLWLERTLARSAAAVIVTDAYRREIIGDMLRLPPERLHVLLNLPLCRSRSREGETIRDRVGADRTIGVYMGLVAPDRHIEDLIEAVAYLPDEYTLALAGPVDEEYRAKLDERIAGLNLESRVYFAGPKPWSELVHFISTADCAFALYDSSSLNNRYCSPNKLFEAAMAGVPVVATANPLIVDVLTETKGGACVEPVTPVSIANTVRQVLEQWSNPTKREGLSKLVESRYSWECQEDEFVKLYQGLVPAESAPSGRSAGLLVAPRSGR
jgi:glycosyltransferase involved in cell wall biosynthesis